MSGRKRDLKVKDKIKEIEELNPILPGIRNLVIALVIFPGFKTALQTALGLWSPENIVLLKKCSKLVLVSPLYVK